MPPKNQFARVLTSPRQRARRTCELAGFGASAVIDPDLSEWNYGDYEGRRSVDIRKERPTGMCFGMVVLAVKRRANLRPRRSPHLPSSVAARQRRALRAWPIRMRTRRAMDRLDGDQRRHFALGAASLSILGYEPATPKRLS